MKGAIAIFLFLAASLRTSDGQQACNYNAITECTNSLTLGVFSNLQDTASVCRAYNQYQQCVYNENGCDAAAIISQLKRQMLSSNVDFEASCESGATATPPPTTWVPPVTRISTSTPWFWKTTRPAYWTTLSNRECNVYDIRMCSTALQVEYDSGRRCDAASNFVMCLNRLVSCTQNPEFTMARQELTRLGLDVMCQHVIKYPVSSASLMSVMTSLPFALMAFLWI